MSERGGEQRRSVRQQQRAARRRYGAAADGDDEDWMEDNNDDIDESCSSADHSFSSRHRGEAGGSAAAAAAAAAAGAGRRSSHSTPAGIKTAQRWTQEEHTLLLQVVEQHGNTRRWSEIAKHIPGRTGKQCRERFVNHQDPDTRKGSWDVAEELLLCKWHSILGSHWARITRKLEGRTENAVKNHWNAAMRAKFPLRRQTPLNIYVGHLRSGVEASEALVKVLEALQGALVKLLEALTVQCDDVPAGILGVAT
ncbi:hypothetical protein OEZ86_003918 [Tetradesmus obliquus]|nr:hypothetical protein OEZ86_003918 [Tetradesmus obliquus]